MDLIVLATEDEQIHFFRFNGQEAFGHPFSKTGISVKATRWKVTGAYLSLLMTSYSVAFTDRRRRATTGRCGLRQPYPTNQRT